MIEWTKEDANKTYLVDKWGEGYFDITPEGKLVVNPNEKSPSIIIEEVVNEMKAQGVTFPTVIRFQDVLRAQVKKINHTFNEVIQEANYNGTYMGVYPVKVNQMREVVEEVIEAGAEFNFGLEAGSKSELLTVLAYNKNKDSLTILNGYKDDDYLKLALTGNKIGRKFIIVVEKFSELERIISLSEEMNTKPLIGIRSKMSVVGIGRWKNSSGDNAKFGLTTSEILNAVELLQSKNMIGSLKLLHFHMGSQISDIKTFKDAINEGGRIYSQLIKLGAELEYMDVGGGLAVDYDGTSSTSDSSMNYSMHEYATDIVYNLKQICDLEGVPHPTIVSESGRALTAHHSCIVTNVIDQISTSISKYNTEKKEGEHFIVTNMREISNLVDDENYLEMYNEAIAKKEECLQAFKLGILTLKERAQVETLFWEISNNINLTLQNKEFVPEGLVGLKEKVSAQYLCNFSVFQSAADSWAINQLLPVLPISRLNERPTNHCTIADITCDSDGKINNFISIDGRSDSLPLHDLIKGEEYILGIFLTGAYQDVMGDNHNLFGRLNEVHVYSDENDPKGFYIEEIIKGNSASKVLSTMQYNPEYMAQRMKRVINREVAKGNIPPREGVRLVGFYEECLQSYTYLN